MTGDAYYTRLAGIRAAAGIGSWPSDCLRHSYASYHLSAFKNAGDTAQQLGQADLDMLFANYRERVKPIEALKFWKLRPEKPV